MLANNSGQPYANSALACYLTKRIYELRNTKTQREIALAAGFARPNIISMFKAGETKVPLDRIASLARALDADPAHLFQLALVDQWPELAQVIDDVYGKQLASANESDIFLTKWRVASRDMDPVPSAQLDASVDAMLAGLFKAPPHSD
jgi:transcriptional regulator with XRE-family HTH domain